jgi:G2/mitotic-specific cyclin-B, other
MSRQYDINSQMRAILIDWLVEVHLKFKLLPETLYLTINLIDRYLGLTQIVRSKLQLVGVTCLLIACKYEEIYPPIVSDVVYITDNAYTAAEILEMERSVLLTLDFDLHVTSPYRFFERFCYLAKPTETEMQFAQYMMEGSLVSYAMLKYSPAVLAASALYFAGKMCRNVSIWTR